MKLTRHLFPLLVAAGIVVAAVALPKVVFSAETESQRVIECNSNKSRCNIYADYNMLPAHIAVATREVYPGVRPDVVQIGNEWHSRFLHRGVLKQVIFIECGSHK